MAKAGLAELLGLSTNANEMVDCRDFCTGFLLFKYPVVQVTPVQGKLLKHPAGQLPTSCTATAGLLHVLCPRLHVPCAMSVALCTFGCCEGACRARHAHDPRWSYQGYIYTFLKHLQPCGHQATSALLHAHLFLRTLSPRHVQ